MLDCQVSGRVLASEQAFFDREASDLADQDLPIPPDQIERYRRARMRPLNTPKEVLFNQLLPLEGKRVLDYGCGMGENACLLAACGAQVTGFDLSSESIAKARRRAELHGLASRTQFDVLPAGKTGYSPASFDVVTGFAILHHLHMDLPTIYEEIARVLVPTGTACFIEPVANSPLLRALRRVAPVRRDATPDERQLLYKDFEPMRRLFSRVEYTHSYCSERLYRLLGPRVIFPLRWLDYQAQRLLPFLRRYYGMVLVIARR